MVCWGYFYNTTFLHMVAHVTLLVALHDFDLAEMFFCFFSQNFNIARNVKAQCNDTSDSWIRIKAPVWGFYYRWWQSATNRHHWILKLSGFIVRIQMPNFTVNKQIKMKPLKVGSRHISKHSLLLRLLFLSYCSSWFINFKAYCLPYLLQVSLLLSFGLKYQVCFTQTRIILCFSTYSFTMIKDIVFIGNYKAVFFMSCIKSNFPAAGSWDGELNSNKRCVVRLCLRMWAAVKTAAGSIWNSVKVSTDDHPTSISLTCELHIKCDLNENEAPRITIDLNGFAA